MSQNGLQATDVLELQMLSVSASRARIKDVHPCAHLALNIVSDFQVWGVQPGKALVMEKQE